MTLLLMGMSCVENFQCLNVLLSREDSKTTLAKYFSREMFKSKYKRIDPTKVFFGGL